MKTDVSTLTERNKMNYSKAFSYMFQDNDWFGKLLVVGLISLIPVVGQLYLLGWSVEVLRRVRANRQDLLPRTHFTEFVKIGFSAGVLDIFFFIPAYLILGFNKILQNIINKNDNVSIFSMSFLCVMSVVALIVAYLMSFLAIVGRINYAKTGDLVSCLNYTETFRVVKANWQILAVVALMEIVAGLIGIIGGIFCFIGLIFTLPYACAVSSHMLGQLWDLLVVPEASEKPVAFRGAAKASDDVMEQPVAPVRKPASAPTEWEDPVLKNEPVEPFEGEIIEKPVEEAVTEAAEEAAEAAEDIAAAVEDDVEKTVAEVEANAAEAPDVILGNPPAEPPVDDDPLPPFE